MTAPAHPLPARPTRRRRPGIALELIRAIHEAAMASPSPRTGETRTIGRLVYGRDGTVGFEPAP